MLDLGDGAELIVRFGVFKALFKLLLPGRIRREGKARTALSFGVELDETRGQIFCCGFCFGLGLLPLIAAELSRTVWFSPPEPMYLLTRSSCVAGT